MYNRKYFIIACVMPHNFCIHANNACNPHWKLFVEELELNVGVINRQKYKRESNQNAVKQPIGYGNTHEFFQKKLYVYLQTFLCFYYSCCGLTQ